MANFKSFKKNFLMQKIDTLSFAKKYHFSVKRCLEKLVYIRSLFRIHMFIAFLEHDDLVIETCFDRLIICFDFTQFQNIRRMKHIFTPILN